MHGNESKLQPGDILCYDSGGNGHTELFISTEDGTAGAHGNNSNPYGVSIQGNGGLSPNNGSTNIYRISKETAQKITNLNTEYASGNIKKGQSAESIDYSKFYFNGIPDGKYSLANRKNIFELLVNSIKELVNFFTGLITYLFRGLVIGIISIFDRFINNTVKSINESPTTIQESGVSATSADDPYSMNRSVTIESLVFGDVDIFDINIFDAD